MKHIWKCVYISYDIVVEYLENNLQDYIAAKI